MSIHSFSQLFATEPCHHIRQGDTNRPVDTFKERDSLISNT